MDKREGEKGGEKGRKEIGKTGKKEEGIGRKKEICDG